MLKDPPYNPLDKIHLGESVASALLNRPLTSLRGLEDFDGAGVYAIYYGGSFHPYKSIAGTETPIYVGKAVPPGSRKGVGLDAPPKMALVKRLREHASSVELAENLDLQDFSCRYLIVDDIWIPLGESLVIAKFSPLWNTSIDGFGNHDPGSGRYQQLRSRWDTLHPGRAWAVKCQDRPETANQIIRELIAYLS